MNDGQARLGTHRYYAEGARSLAQASDFYSIAKYRSGIIGGTAQLSADPDSLENCWPRWKRLEHLPCRARPRETCARQVRWCSGWRSRCKTRSRLSREAALSRAASILDATALGSRRRRAPARKNMSSRRYYEKSSTTCCVLAFACTRNFYFSAFVLHDSMEGGWGLGASLRWIKVIYGRVGEKHAVEP